MCLLLFNFPIVKDICKRLFCSYHEHGVKVGHITGQNPKMMCPTVICSIFSNGLIYEVVKTLINPYFLAASSTATAQATVIPTMGLLPAPIRPIIST